MAALVGLIVLETVKSNSDHIESVGNYYHEELSKLKQAYSDKVVEITGHRHLAGISLANGDIAGKFHRACLDQGLFVRLQAYKEGASTIITKPPIIVDSSDVDFVMDKLHTGLKQV